MNSLQTIAMCFLVLFFSEKTYAQYQLTVYPSAPYTIHANFEIDSSNEERIVVVRGLNWGLKSQVSDPMCGKEPLSESGQGEWIVPKTCKNIQWEIQVLRAENEALDVSRQQSLYFEDDGWWLISEPSSLLSMQGDTGTRDLEILSDTEGFNLAGVFHQKDGSKSLRVPSANKAPEFYAAGNIHIKSRQYEGMKVTYVSDNPRKVEKLGLDQAHAIAFGFLASIFPSNDALDKNDNQLVVFWIGVDEKFGRAGGAAGGRSFMANYIVGKRKMSRLIQPSPW